MATKIFLGDYWPLYRSLEVRRFDYKAVDGSMPPITSVFSYDPGSDSMLLMEYDAHLTWKDTWFYQYKPGFGIAEWRDDYPGKKVVMDPPIGWGNTEEIGSNYINYPQMSFFKSWPPANAKGIQIVVYEDLLPFLTVANGTVYKDVLQQTNMQAWSGNPGGGARYWFAKGIGPIAVQWIAQDPKDPYGKPLIETARMDATVTIYNTGEV